MNGSFSEHYMDGLAWLCDTCGSIVIKRDAHSQWHEIITDAITHPPILIVADEDDIEVEVATGSFTVKGGAENG